MSEPSRERRERQAAAEIVAGSGFAGHSVIAEVGRAAPSYDGTRLTGGPTDNVLEGGYGDDWLDTLRAAVRDPVVARAHRRREAEPGGRPAPPSL